MTSINNQNLENQNIVSQTNIVFVKLFPDVSKIEVFSK